MAASSLQNSSSTITPSSSVVWSMLRGQTGQRGERTAKVQVKRPTWDRYVRDALWLQAQQPLPDEQQFGCEVWDAVSPQHEISDHLQRFETSRVSLKQPQ